MKKSIMPLILDLTTEEEFLETFKKLYPDTVEPKVRAFFQELEPICTKIIIDYKTASVLQILTNTGWKPVTEFFTNFVLNLDDLEEIGGMYTLPPEMMEQDPLKDPIIEEIKNKAKKKEDINVNEIKLKIDKLLNKSVEKELSESDKEFLRKYSDFI